MSTLLLEGFDLFGATSNITRKFTNATGTFVLATGYNNDGYALKFPVTAGTTSLTTPVFDDKVTLIAGAAVYLTGGFDSTPIVHFSLDNNIMAVLRVNTDGTVSITDVNGTVLGRSTDALFLDTWQYLEIKVVAGTSGSVKVQRNNLTLVQTGTVSLTNTNARVQEVNNISFLVSNTINMQMTIDDLYVFDSLGSYHNDFRGPCHIGTLLPGTEQGSPSPAWETVDNVDWASLGLSSTVVARVPPSLDQGYRERNPGQFMIYTPQANSLPSNVWAVQLDVLARKSDLGSISFYPLLFDTVNQTTPTLSPVTTYGQAVNPLTDFYYTSFIYEQDPILSTSWDISKVNNTAFGVQ